MSSKSLQEHITFLMLNYIISMLKILLIRCAQLLQSCLTLCFPVDCSSPGSSVHSNSPGKDTGVGCSPSEDLIDLGIRFSSLMFLTLAGKFFTTSTTWEDNLIGWSFNNNSCYYLGHIHKLCFRVVQVKNKTWLLHWSCLLYNDIYFHMIIMNKPEKISGPKCVGLDVEWEVRRRNGHYCLENGDKTFYEGWSLTQTLRNS